MIKYTSTQNYKTHKTIQLDEKSYLLYGMLYYGDKKSVETQNWLTPNCMYTPVLH